MVNKQGQTRLAQYYEYMTVDERAATEAEIIRKCLARNEMQVEPSRTCIAGAFAVFSTVAQHDRYRSDSRLCGDSARSPNTATRRRAPSHSGMP